MQADPQVSERIHNCQVITYSRRCPSSGELHADFRFMRSVCPWDLSLSRNEWHPIDRSGGLYGAELTALLEDYPRMYNDDDDDDERAPRLSGNPEQGLACAGEWPVHTTDAAHTAEAAASSASEGRAPGSVAGHSAAALGTVPTSGSSSIGRARRVLLLTKTARWRLLQEDEARRHEQTTLDRMRDACTVHESAVSAVSEALNSAGFHVSLSQDARHALDAADCDGIELCLALGGDGTVLRAAHAVPTGAMVIGVNTDPGRSVGKHCAVAIRPENVKAAAAAFASQLWRRAYEAVRVPRLRVTIDPTMDAHDPLATAASEPPPTDPAESASAVATPKEAVSSTVDLAVNECFLGEENSTRPWDFELSVDGGPWTPWRSSGLIAATQLGSSAWLRQVWGLHEAQAAAILQADAQLHQGEVDTPSPAANGNASTAAAAVAAPITPHDQQRIAEVTAAANEALLGVQDEGLLRYVVREALPRERGDDAAQPSSVSPPHGQARRLQVRWRRYGYGGAIASVDGRKVHTLPPPSCLVTIEVEPDRQRWLLTGRSFL